MELRGHGFRELIMGSLIQSVFHILWLHANAFSTWAAMTSLAIVMCLDCQTKTHESLIWGMPVY